MQKKIIVVIAAIVLLAVLSIGGYFGAYYYSLSKVKIQELRVTEVSDIGVSGFTVAGYVRVYNGGIMPVRINNITYSITVNSTGEKISDGIIQGEDIPAKESTDFEFSQKITWGITAKTALKAITTGKLYVRVDGTVSVGEFFTNEFPFRQEMNLVDYIKSFSLLDLL